MPLLSANTSRPAPIPELNKPSMNKKTFCNTCLKYKQDGKIIVLANKAKRFRCSDCMAMRAKVTQRGG